MITELSKIIVTNKPEVTDLCGEKVMVDFKNGKYFMLKGVGNDIWNMLEDEIAVQQIINQLMEEYEVDTETCKTSTIEFLEKLEKLGFVESVAP